jgi:hypothetical protein
MGTQQFKEAATAELRHLMRAEKLLPQCEKAIDAADATQARRRRRPAVLPQWFPKHTIVSNPTVPICSHSAVCGFHTGRAWFERRPPRTGARPFA